jgi:hypothetical protein
MEDKYKSTKIELTLEELKRAEEIADKRMKESNGHSYVHMLKTRCQFCGRSPKQGGLCRAWFQTFLFQLDTVLLNKEYKKG